MSSPLEKNFIPTKDASAFSGYNADYLARLCRSGKIEGTRIGRSWLVSQVSLEAFMKEQGERKQELRELLSETREKEYQHSVRNSDQTTQTPISRTVHKITPAITELSSGISKHLTSFEKTSAFQKQGVAVLVAMIVLLFGIYTAQAITTNAIPEKAATTALAISTGIREMTLGELATAQENAQRSFAQAAVNNSFKEFATNTATESTTLAPANSATSLIAFVSPIVSPLTRALPPPSKTSAHVAKIKNTKNKKQLAVTTNSSNVKSLPLLSVAEGVARLEVGAVLEPRAAAVALAAVEVSAYANTGAVCITTFSKACTQTRRPFSLRVT
jgi:hypothetical protein